MVSRDEENMRWGLRIEVIERHAEIIFVNLRRRNLARRNLAENTVPGTHLNFTLEHSVFSGPKCKSVSERDFLAIGRGGGIARRDSFDIRADRTEFLDDFFVAAIDVIYAVDEGFAACAQGREDK